MSVKHVMAALAFIASVALSLGGCSSGVAFRSAPTVVAVGVQSSNEPGAVHRGQGVVVGRRILTAAHTFLRDGATFPEDRIVLNGRDVPANLARHGDPAVVHRIYQGNVASWQDLAEDWVCFELPFEPTIPGQSWSIRSEPLTPGEKLYAVRWNETAAAWDTALLETLDVESEEHIPANLILVANQSDGALSGWSGSFVGSYSARENQWQFTGILIAGKEFADERYHVVLKPDEETLRWLMNR